MSEIETVPVMTLRPQDIDHLVDELQAYHAIYSPLFQRREQRQWSADYLRGLLLEMPRKSIEPMMLTLHGADRNAIRGKSLISCCCGRSDRHILFMQARSESPSLSDIDPANSTGGTCRERSRFGRAATGPCRRWAPWCPSAPSSCRRRTRRSRAGSIMPARPGSTASAASGS